MFMKWGYNDCMYIIYIYTILKLKFIVQNMLKIT